jgi:hypothetical protein
MRVYLQFKSGHLLVSVTFISIALDRRGTNNSVRRALTSNCFTFRRRITEPHSITLGWIYPAVCAAVSGCRNALGWSFCIAKTPKL